MSRWEFMRQLEELLSDISPSEREEALQYYNDYFNDAGRENEGNVMEALGSPEQVAQIVKDGLGGVNTGEFTESGFKNTETVNSNAVIKRPEQDSAAGQDTAGFQTAAAGQPVSDGKEQSAAADEKKSEMPAWAIVLIVIGCIICSPAILGLAGAAVGLIVSLLAATFSLVLGLGVTALILFVVAIALMIAGFGCLTVYPVSAIGLFGGACICLAVGVLFMLLTVFIAGKCIPGICQGIGYIFKKLFGKKEGNKT